jgi:hypothetical protein
MLTPLQLNLQGFKPIKGKKGDFYTTFKREENGIVIEVTNDKDASLQTIELCIGKEYRKLNNIETSEDLLILINRLK